MTTTMRERFDELRKQVAGHYDVALPPEIFSFIEQELKKELVTFNNPHTHTWNK